MTQLFLVVFGRKPKHAELTETLSVLHTIAEIMTDLRCDYDRAFALAYRAAPGSTAWRRVRYLIQDHAEIGLSSVAGVRRAATVLSRAERKARGEAVATTASHDTPKPRPITFESLFGDAL